MSLAFEECSRGGIHIHGVILAAGKGERMGSLTEEVPKALLPVGNKALVDLAIQRLLDSGIKDIVVAVGWKGQMVEDHLSSSTNDVRIIHVSNYETGPLQTLLTTIETFDDDFLLTPVDLMIDQSALSEMLAHAKKSRGMILAVDYSANSGTQVSVDKSGKITGLGPRVSETDTLGRSAMLFIGNSNIVEYCRAALKEGETKFASVLDIMVRDEQFSKAHPVDSSIIDIDTMSDLLEANHLALDTWRFPSSKVVFVPPGDSIEVGDTIPLKSNILLREGAEIVGPVLISQNCTIGESCRIGPYTTLGANSTLLTGCIVSDSIVFGESKVSSNSRVHSTIVYKSNQYSVK